MSSTFVYCVVGLMLGVGMGSHSTGSKAVLFGGATAIVIAMMLIKGVQV